MSDVRHPVRLEAKPAVTTGREGWIARTDFATVTATNADGHMLLVLRGEFDDETIQQLHGIARELWANEGLDVLVDGRGITFASSALITMLHRLRTCAEDSDHTMTITEPSAALRRLLELTGLGSWLQIHAASLAPDTAPT